MKFNKNFYLLLIGQSFADIGDVLYIVTVISTIYMLTDSVTAASFVPFVITTSMFISSVLTPLLMGRINLKWLLAGSQFCKTILVLLLGLLLFTVTESNYYYIFIVISGIALLDGCANPIKQTMTPYFVRPEQLLRANSIVDMVGQVIFTMMWFIGSLLLVLLGVNIVILSVVILFACASLLLCLIENVDFKTPKEEGKFRKIQKGWQTLFNTPVLKKIVMVDILETIAGTVWLAVILLVYITEVIQVGEQWWGYINAMFFMGLIFGSVYCLKFDLFIEKRMGNFILSGSLLSFIATLLFSFNHVAWLALILSFCVGFFGQVKSIPQQTIIQTSVSQEKLPTVYTSLGAITTVVFGVSSLMVGVVADLVGVRVVFGISASILALVSLLIYRNRHLFNQIGIEADRSEE